MRPDHDDIDFQVLGPLRAVRAGAELALRGDKPRAVLALLLVRRNRAVPPFAFADEVWAGRDASEIQANLQVLISNLRRLLGPERNHPDNAAGQRYIRTSPAGYTITVPDEHHDLVRFRARREEGNRAREQRRPDLAATAYAAALREWRGERGLEDLAGLPFADAFAQSVEQELLSTLAARIEADLACHRHHEVLGELYQLGLRYPLNDVFCGQLLTALAASGRSAEAAEHYHRFRERYHHEVGSAVPEPLRRVWAAVSRQEIAASRYGSITGPDQALRTMVEENLLAQQAELVHGNGGRTPVTGRVTLGRVGCDLLLADPKISKTHAVISPTPDGFVITDLQSTNGTFVNSAQMIAPQILQHLDRIRMGDTELVFRIADVR